MKSRVVYRIANVLILSLLRATRNRGGFDITRIINRARSIAVLDLAVFVSAFTIVHQAIARVPGSPTTLISAMAQALSGIPIYVTFLTVMIGVFLETSQQTNLSSSDIVNWLPIRVAEYVLGCALSTVYTYSFFLAAIIGAALGVATWTGEVAGWIALTFLSAIAMLLGAFVVEIVRAVVNRAASSFYRRGGRPTIAIRLVGIIALMTGFSLVFWPQLYLPLLQAQVEGMKILWFIPIFWSSLAVASSLEAQPVLALTYSALTVTFTGALFYAAVALRRKYWTPAQVSITMTKEEYKPRMGLLLKIGFAPAESAMIRKDLKAITRRTEMMGIFAIPPIFIAFLAIMAVIDPGYVQRGGLQSTLFLGVLQASFFISATSVGQEGRAVWHIHASAIDHGQLVKAKAAATLLVATPLTMILALVTARFTNMSFQASLQLCVAVALLTMAEDFLGLAVGTRHPSFQEAPKKMFITVEGYFIGGILVGIPTLLLVLIPITYTFYAAPSDPIVAFVMPIVIVETLVLSAIGYHFAKSGAKKLLAELPTQ